MRDTCDGCATLATMQMLPMYETHTERGALVFARRTPGAAARVAWMLAAVALCGLGNAVLLPLTWQGAEPDAGRAVIAAWPLAIAGMAALLAWGLTRAARPGAARELARFAPSSPVVSTAAWGEVPRTALRAVSTPVWYDAEQRALVLWRGDDRVRLFRGVAARVDGLLAELVERGAA